MQKIVEELLNNCILKENEILELEDLLSVISFFQSESVYH